MFENVRGVLKIIAVEVQFLHSLSLKSSQLLDLLVMLLRRSSLCTSFLRSAFFDPCTCMIPAPTSMC